MVKPLAGSITNTVHRTHAARVTFHGAITIVWALKRLAAESGTSTGVLASVSKTVRRVRVVLVEE
jgi:hypothetical protein